MQTPHSDGLERSQKSASGFAGVAQRKDRFYAQHCSGGLQCKVPGSFDTAEDAARARKEWKIQKQLPAPDTLPTLPIPEWGVVQTARKRAPPRDKDKCIAGAVLRVRAPRDPYIHSTEEKAISYTKLKLIENTRSTPSALICTETRKRQKVEKEMRQTACTEAQGLEQYLSKNRERCYSRDHGTADTAKQSLIDRGALTVVANGLLEDTGAASDRYKLLSCLNGV